MSNEKSAAPVIGVVCRFLLLVNCQRQDLTVKVYGMYTYNFSNKSKASGNFSLNLQKLDFSTFVELFTNRFDEPAADDYSHSMPSSALAMPLSASSANSSAAAAFSSVSITGTMSSISSSSSS